ncbi:MAG TPA: hypothetical protein VKA68_15815 [bacterium]|nr:hypothetical protein [bacterium]
MLNEDAGIDDIIRQLTRMEQERIWPNGIRYLWTDAFGVVLLCSLYQETGQDQWLGKAKWMVSEVEDVLGRDPGFRIGGEPDRHGQHFHYLGMWMYAMYVLGIWEPEYRQQAVRLAREIHPYFIRPGHGVYWKMQEDLSGPEPGFGFGALDHFQGYVIYTLLAPRVLSRERQQMQTLIEKTYKSLQIDQDLGLGIMLWLTHFLQDDRWAKTQQKRSLKMLRNLWVNPPGYFCRSPGQTDACFAFTNYGVALGLQSTKGTDSRIEKMHRYFAGAGTPDEYADSAITYVMDCVSHFPGLFLKDSLEAAEIQG